MVAAPMLKERVGVCPTCGRKTHFLYLGEQRYPERVARAAGLPTLMQVWRCGHCQTTLLEPDENC